jgi:acetyltransferase
MPRNELVRYCNVDFVTELAFVAEIEDSGRKRLIGVVRLCIESAKKAGEFAVIVADRWQGLGLGKELVKIIINIGKRTNLNSTYGIMLSDNYRMIGLVKSLGFRIRSLGDGTTRAEFSYNK